MFSQSRWFWLKELQIPNMGVPKIGQWARFCESDSHILIDQLPIINIIIIFYKHMYKLQGMFWCGKHTSTLIIIRCVRSLQTIFTRLFRAKNWQTHFLNLWFYALYPRLYIIFINTTNITSFFTHSISDFVFLDIF